MRKKYKQPGDVLRDDSDFKNSEIDSALFAMDHFKSDIFIVLSEFHKWVATVYLADGQFKYSKDPEDIKNARKKYFS